MLGKTPSTKTRFRLTPKHLLLTAFIIVAIAVAALIVSVFQTLNPPQQSSTSRPAANDTVEIWSPRGANSQAAPGTVVNAPNIPGTTPPPAETASEAVAPRRTATPNRQTPTESAPAQTGERPLQPINKPAPASVEPTVKHPTPAPAPSAARPQPAQRQQSKDVMDNLF